MTKPEFAASIEAAIRTRYESNILRDLNRAPPDTTAPKAVGLDSPFLAEIDTFLGLLASQHGFASRHRNLEPCTDTVYCCYMRHEVLSNAGGGRETDSHTLYLEIETSFLTSAPDLDQIDRNFGRLAVRWRFDVSIWVAALPTSAHLIRHLANCKSQIDKYRSRNEDKLFLFVLFDQSTGQTTVESHRAVEEDSSASDRTDDSDDTLPTPYHNPAPGRGRHALRHLRSQLLSLPPGDALDKLVFRTLEPHGVDHFLDVSRLLTYHEPGRVKAAHGDESKVLLASIDKQYGYSFAMVSYLFTEGFDPFSECSPDADGETWAAVFRAHETWLKDSYTRGHYVLHDPLYLRTNDPFFREYWTELPRYTTDIDVALRLKDDIFAHHEAIPLILKEIRTTPSPENGNRRLSYCAELRDPQGPTTRSPVLNRPAMAVLVATVDHLLKIMGEAATESIGGGLSSDQCPISTGADCGGIVAYKGLSSRCGQYEIGKTYTSEEFEPGSDAKAFSQARIHGTSGTKAHPTHSVSAASVLSRRRGSSNAPATLSPRPT